MYALLSHPVAPDGPNWPGAPGLTLRRLHRIDQGDAANTHVFELYSHYGTHVDGPYHFNPEGARLSELPLETFIYDRPSVFDLSLDDCWLIREEDLANAVIDPEADLLIIRSGFERHRVDRPRYEMRGPGFSAAAARHLRDTYPTLRAIALDWLSLAAFEQADEGVEAHRELLGRQRGDRAILVYEDVRVSGLAGRTPSQVIALPLFIEGLEASPCTIIARVDGEAGTGEPAPAS
jgi:kynurenine formamidase